MNKIIDKVVEYIVAIPQLLFTAFMSFLSGHIWLWALYSFFLKSNKGLIHLKSIWAKTGLGLLWYSLFILPSLFIKYGWTLDIEDKILSILTFAVLLGAFVQTIFIILIISFKKQ